MRWLEISQATEIEVKGNAGAEPFVTVVMKEDMPYLQLSKKDEILRLHYDFKKNDVIKIDFEKNKVFINDKLQMKTIDLLYADFFSFESGINLIRTIPSMQIEVEYTERWK
ncbi:phage distal tail protein [Virgibacillus alimentarius]|uniref:phage distal tail protein n=1 Tax=Virgibacillus alimentarius TaxID=698769 RepID=UPI00049333D6|nr:phage tail domain-containing protein [Virgibacillus alimentarius]